MLCRGSSLFLCRQCTFPLQMLSFSSELEEVVAPFRGVSSASAVHDDESVDARANMGEKNAVKMYESNMLWPRLADLLGSDRFVDDSNSDSDDGDEFSIAALDRLLREQLSGTMHGIFDSFASAFLYFDSRRVRTVEEGEMLT